MVRIALVSLILAGCSGSSIVGQPDAGDGGAQPVATCNGGSDQCACVADSDCAMSVYPRVATADSCFCPSPCAYNPVRSDQATVRAGAYQQNCQSGSIGIPDGGCGASGTHCETLQPRCFQGACAGF